MRFDTNASDWSLEVDGKPWAPWSKAPGGAAAWEDRGSVRAPSGTSVQRVARYALIGLVVPFLTEVVATKRGGHPAWLLAPIVLVFPVVIALARIETRADLSSRKKRLFSLLVVTATLAYVPLRAVNAGAIRRLTRRDSVTTCELEPGKVHFKTGGGFFDVADLDAPPRCVNVSIRDATPSWCRDPLRQS